MGESEEADLAAIGAIALNDDELTESMLSPAGDMALAVIKFYASTDDQAERLSIAQSVVDLRDSLRENYPDLTIYVLGQVVFELDGRTAQVKDSTYLAPIVLIIVLAQWFCLRHSRCPCAHRHRCWLLITDRWYRGFGPVPFNQISNMGPLVDATIAMADGIHVISVYLQGLDRSMDKLAAMRESLAVNVQPVRSRPSLLVWGF